MVGCPTGDPHLSLCLRDVPASAGVPFGGRASAPLSRLSGQTVRSA
ncbi:MAG: hypothetical protein OJF62_003296 [Pseudolabrys sp.]|nr:hypothetical protein [Pseudolabrys sp.]